MNLLLESMKALSVTIGILAVGMLVIYLVRSINSKEYVALGPHDLEGPWTIKQKLHAAGVHLGYFVFISAGVQEILEWTPLRFSSESPFFPGALIAFASLPFLWSFQSASYDRREILVTRAALSWVLDELRHGALCISVGGVSVDMPKIGLIEKIETELSSVYGTERYNKEFTLSVAQSVQRFYEELEKQIGRQLIREQERSKHELAEKLTRQEAARKQQEEQRAAELVRRQTLFSDLVRTQVQPRPPLRSNRIDLETESIVDSEQTMQSWQQFKQLVVATMPESEELIPDAASKLLSNLSLLDDIYLDGELSLKISYNGSSYNGWCDVIASGDPEVPLYKALRYSPTVNALTTALFLAAALPGQWAWGHGLGGRDHQLIVSAIHLRSLLEEEISGGDPPSPTRPWPPPGIRVSQLDDGFTVACISARPGLGLFDLSLRVVDGRARDLEVQEIYMWGKGILY